MGFKNAAQRKAVWASRNEKKKGSPAKQSVPDFKGTGNRLKRSMGQSVTGLSDERSQDKVINKVTNTTKKLKPVQDAFTNYMDWNDDGKVTTSDYVKEAASWLIPGGAFVKGAKYLNKARKFLSPFKHCDSEMMHSGGWGQVRKYNSPGTTGNKEGIKHNEKMRKEIGTFKMPHSPLNKGHEANKDSIASSKAWKAHKEAYLKKPGGLEEYNREKGEFYYSPKHGKLRLIPTDDAEVKDKSGIEKWQLAPDRKSSKTPLNQMSEGEKRRYDRAKDESGETQTMYRKYKNVINDGITQKANPAQISNKLRETFPEVKNNSVEVNWSPDGSEVEAYNMTPNATPEESKAVRDKFDATYLKGRGPFQKKKEGKKDACYHKVKSRVKVWPSAYASGQLVQCRKAGAANWGNKSKKK